MSYTDELKRKREQKLLSEPVILAEALSAEWALLVAILCDAENDYQAYRQAEAYGIHDTMFCREVHALIWNCFGVLIDESEDRIITRPVLERLLHAGRHLNDITNTYLDKLFADRSNPDEARIYAREIKDAAETRQGQLDALEIAVDGPKLGLGRMRSRFEEGASHITPRTRGRQRRPMKSMLKDFASVWQARLAGEGVACFGVGMPCVDVLLDDGFQSGRLYYIGGEEKAGKTRFVAHCVGELLERHDAIVDWYSVEMGEYDMMSFLVAQRLNADHVADFERQGRMDSRRLLYTAKEVARAKLSSVWPDSDKELYRFINHISNAEARLEQRDMYMTVVEDETARDIFSLVRLGVSEHKKDIESGRPYVAVIDYVQDLEPGEKNHSEAEKIKMVSKRLRAMAKVLDIIVIGVFHTNRNAQKEGAPKAHHVFGSSKLSKDADHLLFVHRPDKNGDDWRYTQIISELSRHCSTGSAEVEAHLGHVFFEEWKGATPMFGEVD